MTSHGSSDEGNVQSHTNGLAREGFPRILWEDDPMWKDRVQHAKDIWAIYPGQTAHLTVRCMNALYHLQVMRGEAMSHLMALLEATKITLDNREELVVDLSTKMVEKDLQVEQLSNEIQELEELVGTRENTIEVLEDQLINTQQQLAEANQHLDMHHQEIQDMEANEDVDIEGGEEPASSLDTAGSGRPPSPESSIASLAH
jgi:septal ring factor EnvC (AmiA/AmiB activator)